MLAIIKVTICILMHLVSGSVSGLENLTYLTRYVVILSVPTFHNVGSGVNDTNLMHFVGVMNYVNFTHFAGLLDFGLGYQKISIRGAAGN